MPYTNAQSAEAWFEKPRFPLIDTGIEKCWVPFYLWHPNTMLFQSRLAQQFVSTEHGEIHGVPHRNTDQALLNGGPLGGAKLAWVSVVNGFHGYIRYTFPSSRNGAMTRHGAVVRCVTENDVDAPCRQHQCCPSDRSGFRWSGGCCTIDWHQHSDGGVCSHGGFVLCGTTFGSQMRDDVAWKQFIGSSWLLLHVFL